MRPEEVKLEKLGVLQARILVTILVISTSSRRGIGFFFLQHFLLKVIVYD